MNKSIYVLLACSIMLGAEISGVGFYNYSMDLTEGVEGASKGSFAFDRVYFTYKNSISDDLAFKFQTDVGQVAEDPRLTAYLKKAQLDWKSPVGKITLGMQGMNMFNVTEKTWGFRFLEKSPMDKHGFSSSADMGVGYSGKLDDLSFSALITNGSGYKKQENDAYKKMSFQLVYGEKKLIKNNGFNIGTAVSMEPYTGAGGEESKTVMSFFSGYAGSGLRIGGEFDMMTDSNGDVTQQIMAFYSSYRLMDNLEGLLYVDMYDVDVDADEDSETYIIAGLNYYPTKGLIVTPNVRMTSFEDGSDGQTMFKMSFQFKF